MTAEERAVIATSIELYLAVNGYSGGLGHLSERWRRADRQHHVAVEALLASRRDEVSQ